MYLKTQFSIFLVNKPGILAKVTSALAKAKINIIALTLMDSMEHGVLRVVCDDSGATRKVLGTAHDRWTETEVLVIELANNPGAFSAVVEKLADNHINISYAYVTGGARRGRTNGIFKVADMKKAVKVLEAGRKRTVKKAGS